MLRERRSIEAFQVFFAKRGADSNQFDVSPDDGDEDDDDKFIGQQQQPDDKIATTGRANFGFHLLFISFTTTTTKRKSCNLFRFVMFCFVLFVVFCDTCTNDKTEAAV